MERKTGKQLERHFKGAANHRRIDILRLVSRQAGITVEDIAASLGANIKTVSQHTRALAHGGLVTKSYRGRAVEHALSPYGKKFVAFMSTL